MQDCWIINSYDNSDTHLSTWALSYPYAIDALEAVTAAFCEMPPEEAMEEEILEFIESTDFHVTFLLENIRYRLIRTVLVK